MSGYIPDMQLGLVRYLCTTVLISAVAGGGPCMGSCDREIWFSGVLVQGETAVICVLVIGLWQA